MTNPDERDALLRDIDGCRKALADHGVTLTIAHLNYVLERAHDYISAHGQQPGAGEAVCPYIVATDEGTHYCKLAMETPRVAFIAPVTTTDAPPAPPASAGVPDGWRIVATDGQPPEGVYVALYRDGSHFPVGLCMYGNWEFFDYEGDDDRADDEGMVHGFGWTEEAEDRSGDGFIHQREVVAYLPRNYGGSDPEMKAIRATLLAAAPPPPGGEGK